MELEGLDPPASISSPQDIGYNVPGNETLRCHVTRIHSGRRDLGEHFAAEPSHGMQ
jgi:hypothetical protein